MILKSKDKNSLSSGEKKLAVHFVFTMFTSLVRGATHYFSTQTGLLEFTLTIAIFITEPKLIFRRVFAPVLRQEICPRWQSRHPWQWLPRCLLFFEVRHAVIIIHLHQLCLQATAEWYDSTAGIMDINPLLYLHQPDSRKQPTHRQLTQSVSNEKQQKPFKSRHQNSRNVNPMYQPHCPQIAYKHSRSQPRRQQRVNGYFLFRLAHTQQP